MNPAQPQITSVDLSINLIERSEQVAIIRVAQCEGRSTIPSEAIQLYCHELKWLVASLGPVIAELEAREEERVTGRLRGSAKVHNPVIRTERTKLRNCFKTLRPRPALPDHVVTTGRIQEIEWPYEVSGERQPLHGERNEATQEGPTERVVHWLAQGERVVADRTIPSPLSQPTSVEVEMEQDQPVEQPPPQPREQPVPFSPPPQEAIPMPGPRPQLGAPNFALYVPPDLGYEVHWSWLANVPSTSYDPEFCYDPPPPPPPTMPNQLAIEAARPEEMQLIYHEMQPVKQDSRMDF